MYEARTVSLNQNGSTTFIPADPEERAVLSADGRRLVLVKTVTSPTKEEQAEQIAAAAILDGQTQAIGEEIPDDVPEMADNISSFEDYKNNEGDTDDDG